MSTISGKYYTLPDGRILRQFYSMTGVYKYEYVDSIPEERIGSAKQTDLALISTILDFIPILSNIKGGIEASLGQDIITDRKLGTVERSILVAAILGGPLVKGAQKFGKLAMSQLPKVKNVLNPDKAKALAKDFYDDYIKNGIQSGYTAVNGLVKKMADLPMPLSPKLSTANGMSVTKTIGESMTEAKETIVQMAGKAKTSVSGKGTGKSTKNTTTLWDIKTTADKTLKYKFNGDTVTAYRDPKTGLWWAEDTTGHGNSAFKVFKEAKGGKELHWVADSDKYGNYILDKHKSSTGTVIKIK